MKQKIVIIGGYGHVGQMIARELGEAYPGQVYAAGRSMERAERFSRDTGGKVKPMQLDVRHSFDSQLWDEVQVVVMCLDQADTAFVRFCLAKGIHYVDISASDDFLQQVEQLNRDAYTGKATVVLSVGLAPGLTNLLARRAYLLLERTDSIEISIMLGLGDQHGKAAIQWTVDQLAGGFTDGRRTDFGKGLGRRTAYRFPFADQYVLRRKLGLPSVATRLCLDSAAVTTLLAWLSASGATRLLKRKAVRNSVVGWLLRKKPGEARCAVKIDARGMWNGGPATAECSLQGGEEARITARVAAYAADALFGTSWPSGVYHMDELFDLDRVLTGIGATDAADIRLNGRPL
ncbi:saccharopine dehydrogenase NADP-binding domain-containing protein [Paenibacillus oceani]|uniref:Saccharopine dehydrogenase NADP-binding domain-containing protein n=1 Tax=Paenibacillus oceani TaxID=2772510 RepID=A0A927C6E9_9BACL|nr:saccharopine dehydrogenase NADP-binding domain-containing protein [Paenibacillus oceani]MBD2860817.1 saccharopine dehydrogenase NADP-binding domain-containing protein [Paenibacillus oceani]